MKKNKRKNSIDQTFQYQLLSRMKSDCEYFLGHGDGHEKHLWAQSVPKQIEKMNELYRALKKKPKWLPKRKIKMYETLMTRKLKGKKIPQRIQNRYL